MGRTIQVIPMNRVEGDLEIRLELDENRRVCDAFSRGTMYRGFENLLEGRGPLDSLVITPRICGICTTAHLNAAAAALDMAFEVKVPPNAQRLRNVTLLVEQIQNDIRHAIFLFFTDFTHPTYASRPWHPEAVQRYAALKGERTLSVVRETRKLLEIVAILGGQWPHSSFMVPGGVVSVPTVNDIAQSRHIIRSFRKWYERRILGCALSRWDTVENVKDLEAWRSEKHEHETGDVGFFLRMAEDAGLNGSGGGHERFISYGGPLIPTGSRIRGTGDGQRLWPAGIWFAGTNRPFDKERITEDISSTYFSDYQAVRHPKNGRTVPDPNADGGDGYSWAKAPRYDGEPAETGPLADMLVAGHPLISSMVREHGASVMIRELARLLRPVQMVAAVEGWLAEMAEDESAYYRPYQKRESAEGWGLVTAPRGGLGHWVRIENGKIDNYQVITPTAWNASPRDGNGVRGPMEEALIGVEVRDPEKPLEVEHIVRSFDPCLVCTVHAVDLK